jgi:hypothetical protein
MLGLVSVLTCGKGRLSTAVVPRLRELGEDAAGTRAASGLGAIEFFEFGLENPFAFWEICDAKSSIDWLASSDGNQNGEV